VQRGRTIPAALGALVLAVTAGGASSASPGATGTQTIDVYPIAGTPTANPHTGISFRGVTSLQGLAVTGSRSGRHGGRVVLHPDGRGFSFLPDHPFENGEQVTVRGAGKLTGAGPDGAVRFGILSPPPRRHLFKRPTGDPGGTPAGAQSFRTRPDLKPPNLAVLKRTSGASSDDIFLGVKAGPGQDGPMIRDDRGRLIWFQPLPAPLSPYDFRAQAYQGRPVLTWWQGALYTGKGRGYGVILDRSYRLVKRVYAGNGYAMDQHEFQITPQGTAFITAYEPVRYDLSSIRGPSVGTVWDSIVQEVDIRTGLVLFEWHSLARVSVALSTVPERGTAPFDPFHVNSIALEGQDRLLLSARNTNALFEIDRHTGRVLWRIGGKASSFAMGPGTLTRGQHQAVRQRDGTITVFDNGGSTRFPATPDRESRGLRLRVDETHRTVSLVHQYKHPGTPLFTRSQGSVQLLPGGDTFIGWGGHQPYMTEFAPDGRSDFEASFVPSEEETYRAYRLPWRGARPPGRPAVAVGSASGLDVYVSWNGATDVARWQLLAGATPNLLLPLRTVSWSDFETRVSLPGEAPRYVAVRALDSEGHTLGTSTTVQPSRAGR
jgi:arylsulfotransferase ASST